MAASKSTSRRTASQQPTRAAAPPELIDPRWLLRTLSIMLVLALVCGYLTLGLLYFIGSWHLVLHPTRDANGGTHLPTRKVAFAPDAASKPQLSGEWYPANSDSPRPGTVVLYLRGGDGQLDAADGTQIAMLHDAGLAILAFDYRGYGASAAKPHPSQARMQQDAEAAWDYLEQVRHFAPDHALVFGSGIGVSLAAQVALDHPVAGLIGYNADADVVQRVGRDPRSRLLPFRILFRDQFSLANLRNLTRPKLLYTVGPLDAPRRAAYQSAADPKLTVEVPTHNAEEERQALVRFLDDTLPHAPSTLTPTVSAP